MSKKKAKKEAVIYDLDGTLTKKSIAKKAKKDKAEGKKVIILTARSADQRKPTNKWLKSHDISADKVVMRPNGDNRPDSKTKETQYRKEIKGKYKVSKAYDDKGSNVKMLRKEGIKAKKVY